jgi:peptide/nickel transport system permease protein
MPRPRRDRSTALEAPDAAGAAPPGVPEGTGLVLATSTVSPVAATPTAVGGVAGATGAALAPANAYKPRKLGVLFWISSAWLACLAALAALSPILPLANPNKTGVAEPRLPPFHGDALLGTDNLGRDMLARVVVGARVSLAVGFMAILLGLLVGGFLGIVAGHFRGRLETLIMGVMDALLAFPALVLALAIITFIADGNATIWHVTFTIGLLSVPPLTRLIRASTLTFGQREFVMAARSVGAKEGRIIRREILPNVVPSALSFSLIGVAVAIVAEGGLAFLGLSVRPPTPTWGGMINEGRQILRDAPHVALVPSFVMLLTVLALNYAGDALQAKFAVREGGL